MSINIYVGNLSANADEKQLKELFERYGEVESARIVSEQTSGRARGFGFVEMGGREEGLEAIRELDAKDFQGLSLKVNEARPRIERNTVHVISRAGDWAVKREGAAIALRVFPTREEATNFADQLLENLGAVEVVIHDKDGSVAARKYSPHRDRSEEAVPADSRAASH